MILTAPDLALLRERPHRTELSLSIFQPNVSMACQVRDDGPNGVPARGSYLIDFKTVTVGDGLDNHVGMTLLVGTASGLSDVGKIRVRSTDSDTIKVAENYNIDWKVNQYLTILKYREVWPVFPLIIEDDPPTGTSVTFYKDYDIEYTNQNEFLGTLICMGPHRAAYREGADVQLWYTSSGTYSMDGYSLASGTYDWSFEGGNPLTSTNAVPGLVTYNTPGHYETSLTITDISGTVDTSYRYVSIYDRAENSVNAPILKWEMSGLHGSRAEGGYTADIIIREPIGDLYDGAVVVIFADDWYGNTKKSLGGNAEKCSQIVFVGYILKGSIRYNYKDSLVEFSIGCITDVMRQTVCYAISVEDINIPLYWYQLKNMNALRAIYHYLKWHSTVLSLADFRFVGDSLFYPVQFFDSDRESLFDAVDNFMRNALIGEFVSDRQGTLWAEVSVSATPNATGTFAPIMEITHQDWMNEPTIDESINDTLSYLEFGGIGYSNEGDITYAITVAAPGLVSGYKGVTEIRSGLIFDPTTGSYQPEILAGNIFADRNARYRSIGMELVGDYRNLDIAPQEANTIDIKAGDTNRGIAINGLYFPTDIDWSWDPKTGLLLPIIMLSKITSGIVGYEIYSAEISIVPRFDSITSNNSASATTISTTHTATGQNRFVIVVLAFEDDVTGLTVDYGGVAIDSISHWHTPAGRALYYCLQQVPPPIPVPTGLQTVTASWTGATAVRMIVETFFGVDNYDYAWQLDVVVTSANGLSVSSTNTNLPQSLADMMLRADFVLSAATGHILTPGIGQTLRKTETPSLPMRLSTSTKISEPITTMSWSSDIPTDWVHIMTTFNPLLLT